MLVNAIDLTSSLINKITQGRNQCFPNFKSENFFIKQLPYAVLVCIENNAVIAQCSLVLRYVRINNDPLLCLGISDIWVLQQSRNKGIASAMLETIYDLSLKKKVDINLLTADKPDLYKKHRFINLNSVNSQWLRIHNFCNYGVSSEIVNDIMIREVCWQLSDEVRNIDLLGDRF